MKTKTNPTPATLVTVYAVQGPEDAFGWSTMCDECDWSEKMLTESGAKDLAKEHAQQHVMIVWEVR